MTLLVPGDPASISALGADLSRQAERLRRQRTRMLRSQRDLAAWRGPPAAAFGPALEAQLRLVEDCSEAMAEAGRALQAFAVGLQEARAAAAEAERFCALHGLQLSGSGTVTLPWGAYSLDRASGYERDLPEGQRLVDRARTGLAEANRTLGNRIQAPVAVLTAVGPAVSSAVSAATVPATGATTGAAERAGRV